jgi:glycosyltransferase involved in cell wall biosynthesis
MASSFHDLPHCLFLFLTGKYEEDEQLAMGDVAELHARGLRWRAVCIADSEVHRKLENYRLDNLVLLASPPAHNLDRTLKELLAFEISKGAGLIHCYDTDYLGSILPWMFGFPNIPVVVSEGPKVQKRIRHYFQSLFYPRIDAILVPSSTLRKRLAQMRPALAHRIRVVHPGLDFNVFNPDHFDFKILRRKWGIDPEHHLVGMIASREYPKAQATFIKAAASFLRNEELAQRTRFVIVGFQQAEPEDPDYQRELIHLIEQFHLQEQIILAPPEESIPKVLGSLDVYVLPSSKAMFGLQAIESLAMGTPIICASGPDANEWTGNSQCGHTMRSGDSFDLQRKLRMILEDPNELKGMGQRAVQFARENYDRHLRTERLHEIYDRAVKRRAAVGGDSTGA